MESSTDGSFEDSETTQPKTVRSARSRVNRAVRRYQQHEGLAVTMAVNFARQHPSVDLQELIQTARIALYRAGLQSEIEKTFPKYAMNAIAWAMKGVAHRPGYVRNAVSLNDVLGRTKSGEDVTLADAIERGTAESYHASLADLERRLSREDDVWHAMHNGSNLTLLQRKILTLRFFDDCHVSDVAKKLRVTKKIVGRESAHAIWKLRRYFAAKGVAVDMSPLKRLSLPQQTAR
jgi:DNA-directed RNA polymerase specialized sigma subunit